MLLCVAIALNACTAETIQTKPKCDEVDDVRLGVFPFAGTTEGVLTWIEEQYEFDAENIRYDLSADRAQTLIKWRPFENRVYSALIWNDSKESAAVTVQWETGAPTLADVLWCFGEPTFYNAFHAQFAEATWTYLELWYPEQGVKVTTHVPRKTHGFSGTQPITDIIYAQPGQPPDLIQRFFWAVDRKSERYIGILQGLRPWPGDITKITIGK